MRTWILSASALIVLMLGLRALLKGRLSLRLRQYLEYWPCATCLPAKDDFSRMLLTL